VLTLFQTMAVQPAAIDRKLITIHGSSRYAHSLRFESYSERFVDSFTTYTTYSVQSSLVYVKGLAGKARSIERL
jgi:hypothetical protein